MNLYDSSFLCLDIGSFSVKALAHRVRSGKIVKSVIQTIESKDTVFALKSAIDELEQQIGRRFDSAFITGDFGQIEFKTFIKTREWQNAHKITDSDIQNQISEISSQTDLYPMHIFPLRYDTSSVSNLLTPVGKTDKKLISIFGAVFYQESKINEIFNVLRNTHIQPLAFFDPSFLMHSAFFTKKENSLFIDLGSEFTTVSLWTARGPVFFNKTMYGQSEITKQISDDLGISLIDAQRIKHLVASVTPEEMDRFTPADSAFDFSRADINEIVISKLNDIAQKIQELTEQSVIKYNPTKIFISGGGTNIVGIEEFISETFGLPVENLGADASIRALSENIWKSQEHNVKIYLERRKKIQILLNKIVLLFKRKNLKKQFIPIMPSTLSFNMKNPETYELFKSGGISMIHVDIMDGFFVDRISGSIEELQFIKNHTNSHLHVHLMTESPAVWASAVANAGADTIIVSTNTAGVRNALNKIKEMGKRCGIALNPETDVSILKPVLKEIDEILIMSVNPGNSGQEFESDILNKISMLSNTRKKYNLKYKISVDGGINPETAKLCWHAGADFLVSGSYLASANNFPLAVQKLLEI